MVRRLRLGVSVVAVSAVVLVGSLLGAPQQASAEVFPTDPTLPTSVSADPLPTTQIDGVAWTQKILGGTVYVGGSFANARPAGAAAGTQLSARANLLSYDLQTGVLLPWNPGANADVRSITTSPDGTRIYVAGQFSQIAGATRYRVAAFSASTGALIGNWQPVVNGRVDAIAATDSTVYFTGEFSSVGGVARSKVAAVSAADGSVLPFSATVAGGYGGKGIVISPDGSKVVFDGSFTSVNGSTNPGRGIAALDASTGASLPWLMNSLLRDGGGTAAFLSLASDSDSVYGTGFDYGGTAEDGFEGSFRANWSDGSLVWMQDCHGDTYGVAPVGDIVYSVSHSHYCGNVGGFPQTDPWTFSHSLAFSKSPSGPLIAPDPMGYRSFAGQQAPSLLHWYLKWDVGTYTGISQAAWTVTGNSNFVIFGGEFPKVQGRSQQGLVRFANRASAPNKIGPSSQSTGWGLSAISVRQGQVRLNWPANFDPDDAMLHYSLYRRDLGTSKPIYQTDLESNFWTTPRMSYADTAVTAGTTYQYLIRATDPRGNTTTSEWVTVTASNGVASNAYNDAVLNDNPSYYWPLGEPSGTTGFDWSAGNDMVLTSGVTRNVSGDNLATPSKASQFAGTSDQSGHSANLETGPQVFSVEAWFKTTSTDGGKIVGFGNGATGNSGSYDRHVYLDNNGRVVFGVYPNQVSVVTSANSYNDGQWHQVVASLSSAGQTLYIDGIRAGVRTDTTSAQSYSGYWRVGGDNIGGWPGVGSAYLNGSIADVSVYSSVLTRDQIQAHWVATGRTATVTPAPADAYGKSVYDLDPDLYWRLGETSGSTAADSGRNGISGVYSGSVVQGVTGAIAGTTNRAARFNPGGGSAFVASTRTWTNPTTYALEAWFKTTSNAGGKIIGFGDSATGTSGNYDRHVYMDSDGRVNYGVWTGQTNIIQTSGAYNDGSWHHVVAEQSSAGMKLYLDGALIGSNNQTNAQSYTGYWRVGGDTSWSGANYFSGTIDEVAVYGAPLSDAEVQAHYSIGSSGAVNQLPLPAFTSVVSDLDVQFDSSASTDPDGTIVSRSWDFGDGTSSSEVSPAHHYAAAGPKTVTLTATDDRGATAVNTQTVTTTVPNVPPVADFTATTTALSVAVDASASTDSDGIASYVWSFGDGSTATGVTANHVYSSAGNYNVGLTVTDTRGGSTVLSKVVTATPPPNAPPTAVFAAVATDLGISVSSTGSADSDGSIASYAWQFGDGGTATGATANHSYSTAGTYTVVLTVTDNGGATGTVQHDVVVTDPPLHPVVAKDGFERTVASGWGTAETGGAWALQGASSSFAVSGGAGVVNLVKGDTRAARLSTVSAANTESQATFAIDRTGAGYYVGFIGRQVGSDTYSARIRFEDPGVVRLYILHGETPIGASYVLTGAAYVPGQKLSVRLKVTGSGPTTVAAKVWRTSDTEPAAWQLSGTDTTAGMQAPGSVGIITYLSSAATSATAKLAIDSLSVIDPTVGGTPPPANVAPTAAFTSTASNLTAAFDASTSTDADGTITGYAWDFGDGTTGTGAVTSHPYTAAGAYTVKLTVTDNSNATAATSKSVTVTAPPPASTLASDSFARTVANGWGTADVGGAWTTTATASSYAVGSGVGVIVVNPGDTRASRLASLASTASVTDVVVSADKVLAGGAMNVTVGGRQVGSSQYSGRIRFEANGQIRLYLLRDETSLASAYLIPNTTYTAGQAIHIRVSVTGTNPTTVAAKIWVDGTAEPAAWTLQATDATAAMQTAGSTGVTVAMSGAATVGTTRVSFGGFAVTAG